MCAETIRVSFWLRRFVARTILYNCTFEPLRLKLSWSSVDEIPFRVLGSSRFRSLVDGPREPTAGYVKLLLPPRQSRGNSHFGLVDFAAVHMSAPGTKRARAYATNVRSWWKLTYERSGGIRVLTLSRNKREDFAAMHRRAYGPMMC